MITTGSGISPPPSVWRYVIGGFLPLPAAVAMTGFLVRTLSCGCDLNAHLTRRSSSEWKLMTAARPPGASSPGMSASAVSSCPSSSFTAIRSAWKTRVAGLIGPALKRPGIARRTISASWPVVRIGSLIRSSTILRNPPAESFLAKFKDQVSQLGFAQLIHQLCRGAHGLIRVEPHVERPVRTEAEATVLPRKLVRRETEVEDNPVHRLDFELLQNGPHFGIRRLNESDRFRQARVANGLRGQCQHPRVSVQTDDSAPRTDSPRHRHEMAAATGGAVQEDRPWALNDLEPRGDFGEQDGLVHRSHGGFRRKGDETNCRGREQTCITQNFNPTPKTVNPGCHGGRFDSR